MDTPVASTEASVASSRSAALVGSVPAMSSSKFVRPSLSLSRAASDGLDGFKPYCCSQVSGIPSASESATSAELDSPPVGVEACQLTGSLPKERLFFRWRDLPVPSASVGQGAASLKLTLSTRMYGTKPASGSGGS